MEKEVCIAIAAVTAEETARMSSDANSHTCEGHLDAEGICTMCGWDSHESDILFTPTPLRPEDIEAIANTPKATGEYYRLEGEGEIKRLVKLTGRQIGAARRSGRIDTLFAGLDNGSAYCPALGRYAEI